MKLDRNENHEGRGKYALVLMRKLDAYGTDSITEPSPVLDALELLRSEGLIDLGEAGTASEFFVLRLRDRYSRQALLAYYEAAREDDVEFALDVLDLADRAGVLSPFCKTPD